jgi:hypothetical protein
MKNIHLLPTEKPSRLDVVKNQLVLFDTQAEGSNTQHLYITSDEEIKGDWCYDEYNKVVFKNTGAGTPGASKKIILTTDQDLIKDCVQAIDDEFLEWFVKNPSCEEINVKKVRLTREITLEDVIKGGFPEVIEGAFSDRKPYKIIIPRGEPKQADDSYVKEQKELRRRLKNLIDELDQEKLQLHPKQETLEEAAEKYAGGKSSNSSFRNTHIRDFTEGVKWQEKRSYSEEDLREAFKHGILFKEESVSTCKEAIETEFSMLVEQFKKK